MIAVDFESFYSRQHTVRSLGPWAYAHHPDTDVYMVSVVGEGIEFVGRPEDFDWDRLTDKHLVSHNAGFDMTMAHACVSRGIIPNLQYASWSCSADMAANCGYPRALDKAVSATFGIELPKVMRQWMSGRQWEYAVEKGRDKELMEYALNDSIYCGKLWAAHAYKFCQEERELSAHTRKLIWRGVTVDKSKVASAVDHLRDLRDAAEAKIPWRDEFPILSLPALRDYCSTLGVPAPKSLAKDSEEAQEWEDDWGGKFDWIAALRDYRRTNVLLGKCEAIMRRIRPDGTMPVYLKYWGAHPGRWSGDAGVNLQNLPRGEMFGVNMREMITPRPGHKFVVVDLSQIEPRVLAYLCGDWDLLKALRDGMPLYEAHARMSMGWTGGSLKKENPARYQLAKARVLGLGYGCGAAKFKHLAKLMMGMTLTQPESKEIVDDWRGSNPAITSFWRQLDFEVKKTAAHRDEKMVYTLPSGRNMQWWHPVKVKDEFGGWSHKVQQQKDEHYVFTWGGKLTENVVQATARDIFAHHLLQVEAAGIPVVFHVHDELVCEVPEDQAKDALDTVIEIMSTPPPWMTDIPLGAEGEILSHYTK
jgi:DNA polymerase I-like protein with 3'-5' exonuclease and polymerase domains